MSGIEIAMMAGSAIMGGASTIMGGIQANKAAKFEAAQLEQKAKTEQAIASRKAAEEARQKRLVASRAQLVGAASGGGRDFDLEGDIEEEGLYRQMSAIWEGDERARGLNMQASARRLRGKQALYASIFKAGTSLMSSGASMYSKFGVGKAGGAKTATNSIVRTT